MNNSESSKHKERGGRSLNSRKEDKEADKEHQGSKKESARKSRKRGHGGHDKQIEFVINEVDGGVDGPKETNNDFYSSSENYYGIKSSK